MNDIQLRFVKKYGITKLQYRRHFELPTANSNGIVTSEEYNRGWHTWKDVPTIYLSDDESEYD
jgi:hypothetical protein